MSTAWSPPPQKQPELLPPNRAKPASPVFRWVIVCVMLAGIYLVMQGPPRPGAVPPAPVETSSAPAWPFVIPMVTLAGLAAYFWRVRARLPGKYRTLEVREEERPAAPEAGRKDPAPFAPVEFEGTWQGRRERVRIDEQGVHWHAAARLTTPVQELDVGWSELQHLAVHETPNPLVVWGWMIAIFGGIYGFSAELGLGALALVAGGALVGFIGRLLARGGSLSITTESHVLNVQSRALDAVVRAAIVAAARERAPKALPPTETLTGWRALAAIFGTPFREARNMLAPDEVLLAQTVATNANPLTDEQRLVVPIQRRLYAIWLAGFTLYLPLSILVAQALRSPSPYLLVPFALFAPLLGLVASSMFTRQLARLSGLIVLR